MMIFPGKLIYHTFFNILNSCSLFLTQVSLYRFVIYPQIHFPNYTTTWFPNTCPIRLSLNIFIYIENQGINKKMNPLIKCLNAESSQQPIRRTQRSICKIMLVRTVRFHYVNCCHQPFNHPQNTSIHIVNTQVSIFQVQLQVETITPVTSNLMSKTWSNVIRFLNKICKSQHSSRLQKMQLDQ